MITVESPFERVIEKAEKSWTPTPKQSRFIQIPFEVDQAGYGGALGSGKSDILMLLPLVYGWHEKPKYKGIFLRRTFPELENEIIPRSQEYFPSTGGIYNIAKHRWEFPAGGMDIFGHAKEEKDIKKYDGIQSNCTRIDEATSFTPFQIEYVFIRRGRAAVGSGLPSINRWGSNPGGVGHLYLRKLFIDPYKAGNKIIRDSKSGVLRTFIPATAQDNKHLLETNPRYYEKLQSISSEAERRAMILGDWYVFEGQVFEEFRLEPLSDEPLNARHVVDGFIIPSWWPKIIGIDWGYSASTFVIWAAISPEGKVYIYRTYDVKKAKISQWTRDVCLLTGGEIDNVRDVRICHSAVQDVGQDQTIFQQMAAALEDAGFKCSLTKGEKNRVGGKQLVHEYLRWRPLPKIKTILGKYDKELAGRIYRMHGDKGLKEYAQYFEEEPEELNLPRLQIFTHSPEGRENSELIECIPSCVYDETKTEDVKEFTGDDPYDCLRNLLYSVRDYFADSKSEFDRQQKIGLASSYLRETQDQTGFYRRCENAERVKEEVYSIRKGGMRRMSYSQRSFGR